MLFNDEKRFDKAMVSHPSDNQILGYAKQETSVYLGPGAYFEPTEENKRSGWSKSGNSKEIMSLGTPVKQSSHNSRSNLHYSAGVIGSHGLMASPLSPSQRSSTGPGYYTGEVFPKSPTRPLTASKATTMGTTPRFTDSASVIKNGVLFTASTSQSPKVGPGHYVLPNDLLLRQSHNVRTRKAEPNSPQSIPINDVRVAMGQPGSSFRSPSVTRTRPRSASAPRGQARTSGLFNATPSSISKSFKAQDYA